MKESKEKGNNLIWIGILVLLTVGVMINKERIRNNQNARELEFQQSMEESSKIIEQGKRMKEVREAMQKFEETSRKLDSLNQNK